MITSIVATMARDPGLAHRAAAVIAGRAGVETGELLDGHKLPVTIESEDNHSMEQVTRWIQSVPGVQYVDVAFVYFDDDPQPGPSPCPISSP